MPAFSLTDRVTLSAGMSGLDRATLRRPEADRLLRGGGRVLPLAGGKPLCDVSGPAPALGWVPAAHPALAEVAEPPVFLGMAEGAARFATDLRCDPDEARQAFDSAKFIDLRSVAGDLTAAEATIAAAAKSVLAWHERHPMCSCCGAPTGIQDAGWRRRCERCGALHFPRTDPVVIMLVLDGERTLIGRQRSFPEGMYSLLAGFMEPGETIENAVRREVREEAGIEVGPVRYLGCQPWPFPTTLMIGCVGWAQSRAITLDPAELEEAFWLDRGDVVRMLAGEHPTLRAPRRDAIARTILEAWAAGEIDDLR